MNGSPSDGIDLAHSIYYHEPMKTEEILRYEAEYQAMQEAFGTRLLIFDFAKHRSVIKKKGECLYRCGGKDMHENGYDQKAPST